MGRGKGITPAEKQVVMLLLQRGQNPSEIARFLGRTPQAIHQLIKRMKSRDELQGVLDMGQGNGER